MFPRTAIAASLLALTLPLDASGSGVIAFDRASALPNERVKVTSALDAPLRLYLVRAGVARTITSRLDRRLDFIGVVKRNRTLTFSMPPLDAGTYALAIWDGESLSTRAARLRLRPTAGCPVTFPNGNRPPGQPRSVTWYGNGSLWAGVQSDGTWTVRADQVGEDGTIGNKLLWVTTPPWEKPAVSGERIDAEAPPLRVTRVNTGSFSGAANPSHMTPVGFPTPGCWRLRARLGDASLTYVVQVTVAPQEMASRQRRWTTTPATKSPSTRRKPKPSRSSDVSRESATTSRTGASDSPATTTRYRPAGMSGTSAVSVPCRPTTPSGTGRAVMSSASSTTARDGVPVTVISAPTAALPGWSVTASRRKATVFRPLPRVSLSKRRKGTHMGHQTVQEAMTSTPTAVTPETTAQEAAQLMKTEDVGSLPIVEDGRLVGVITDRDLAIRALAEGRGSETAVTEIASKDVVTIDPQQSIEEAARLMAEHQVRRLPVVEEDGRLVGMLAQADVAQAGHDSLTGEVVQKISQ